MVRACKWLLIVWLFINPDVKAQNFIIRNDVLKVEVDAGGYINNFVYGDHKTVEFRTDEKYRGPALFLSEKRLVLSKTKGSGPDELEFSGGTDTLDVGLNYRLEGHALAVVVRVKNRKPAEIKVPCLSFKLGVNTEMDSFPHWNDVYFPTLMRCEATHFWGYLMNPGGEILIISSPDAAASWHYDYKAGQHRIFTANIDLLHALPLPERHPKNLYSLKAGEEKTWTIRFQQCDDLSKVKEIAAAACEAPMIDAPLYTIAEGEVFSISIIGKVNSAVMTGPGNTRLSIGINSSSIAYRPDSGIGKYRLLVTGINGKVSEAIFTFRHPWSWYLQKARLNALEQEQKGGSHTESWYGFFSMFLAQKYFPDDDLLKASLKKFNEIYPLMYDERGFPKSKLLWGSWDITNRIQNTACMVSLLADLYEVTGDTGYLVKASGMCDFLMKNQDSTGAYRNGKTHYTSVVYIAKSFMEIAEAEKPLSESSPLWKSRYQTHFESAGRAIDELVLHGDDVQTEGEMTYEDGMIACSYAQISMYATLIPESRRQKYIDAAEYLRKGHRSLSQLLVPDSRMNGGSLRYWESQYDILSFPNLMSSPHGWSAWRIYGLWYLYQLNGNPDLIEQIYNALGSDVQLIDEKSGLLRWAFCVDPYIQGKILVKDPGVTIRENRGVRKDTVIGEQYIDMISDWYKAKPDTWVTGYWEPDGGCCDNDVHEIFKCMEEVVLTNACVVQMPDGKIRAYNCKATVINGVLEIVPGEKIVTGLNINNQNNKELRVSCRGKSETIPANQMITLAL